MLVRPKSIIIDGKCPAANASPEKMAIIQKIRFWYFPLRITEEVSHIQNDIKKRRNMASSPIPADMDAVIEVGNGGWGRGPNA